MSETTRAMGSQGAVSGPRHAAGPKHRPPSRFRSRPRSRWSRPRKVVAAATGIVLAGGTAFAATSWVVGLNSGSSGEGQSATLANISLTAGASPPASQLLYPGGTGDAVVTIGNTNSYPVTITALSLPANTVYATGWTNSALTATNASC